MNVLLGCWVMLTGTSGGLETWKRQVLSCSFSIHLSTEVNSKPLEEQKYSLPSPTSGVISRGFISVERYLIWHRFPSVEVLMSDLLVWPLIGKSRNPLRCGDIWLDLSPTELRIYTGF